MVKFKNFYIFIFAALLGFVSCGGNRFKVIFSFPENVTGNYEITYYASDKKGGVTIEAVAPLMQGKYELQGVTVIPTILYITSRGMKVPIIAYVERDQKIEITGDDNDPYKWRIGGNKINESLTEWRLTCADTLARGTRKGIDEAVKNFVTSHPDDPASTLILLNYYSRKDDPFGFHKLWGTLQGEAKKTKWLNITERADLIETDVTVPARLKSLRARTLGGYADTLFTHSEGATLLFFWRSGMEMRKEHIDSLKSLSKEFPDSTSRVIADFSFDMDSLAWKAPLKRDSLENVARFWMPAGFADESAIKLGIGSVPFYIVFSPSGEQKYRGEDAGEALAVFRTLMKTDSVSQ